MNIEFGYIDALNSRSYNRFYFIIIIIKTSSTGSIWENKIVYKLPLQPHKQLRHWKLKKTQRREATTVLLLP